MDTLRYFKDYPRITRTPLKNKGKNGNRRFRRLHRLKKQQIDFFSKTFLAVLPFLKSE